jgi:hypothetical protein
MTEKTFMFPDLESANLYVDALYRGGRKGNAGDDPFPSLLKVSNQGGFRYRGNLQKLEMVVLTSSINDPDWPDAMDRETGVFTYYGDNKKPGLGIHETPRNGNELLRLIFSDAHSGREGRSRVPPILVFANAGEWRDVRFIGLAVPGALEQRPSEDLVAIWRMSKGLRFQNYRAHFTVLDSAEISRSWLDKIIAGEFHFSLAPTAWLDWIETGRYRPLRATRSIEHRTKTEQIPERALDLDIIRAVHAHFTARPHDFEKCAAAIANMLLPNIASLDLTRPSRDGGRDAIGTLRLGHGPGSILVEFAIEAKCYGLNNSVGVREMSRLISRLRHRQFGVLVTTSFVDLQAYREVKEDQHPIIIIAGRDIVDLLRLNGYADLKSVRTWLARDFSP